MLFSVIYSFECPADEPVSWYYPRNWRKLWDLTECHFSEYDEADGLPVTERMKHRKVTALLTKEQFLEFVDDCSLRSEDVETIGSLGAPGFGFGWSPAVAFYREDGYSDGWADAYVTPIPLTILDENGDIKPVVDAFPLDERHWNRVRDLIVQIM